MPSSEIILNKEILVIVGQNRYRKKSLVVLAILLLASNITCTVFSQEKEATFNARNTFYAGFSTEVAYYSVNYDRIIKQNKKLAWSYRFGFSILENAITLPIGINLITGKNNSHAEFSLSIIPYIDKYKSFLSSNDLSDKHIYVVPGVGYRYQKPNGGFFFKILVSPTIHLDPPSSNFWKMDPKLLFTANCGLGISF